jgi:hypothetical protein
LVTKGLDTRLRGYDELLHVHQVWRKKITLLNTENSQEEMAMKTLNKILVLLCGLAFLTSFSGCKEQGPMESAGEKIDQSVEKTQEKMEEVGNSAQDKAEEVGENIEEAKEDMRETTK